MDGTVDQQCTALAGVRRTVIEDPEFADLLYDTPSESNRVIANSGNAWTNILSAIERGTIVLENPDEPVTPLSKYVPPPAKANFKVPFISEDFTLAVILGFEKFHLSQENKSIVDSWSHNQ